MGLRASSSFLNFAPDVWGRVNYEMHNQKDLSLQGGGICNHSFKKISINLSWQTAVFSSGPFLAQAPMWLASTLAVSIMSCSFSCVEPWDKICKSIQVIAKKSHQPDKFFVKTSESSGNFQTYPLPDLDWTLKNKQTNTH